MERKLSLFRELFTEHGSYIAGTLRGHNYSEEEISEIMQNSYMKAFKKFHTLDDENAFRSWFMAIVMNEGKQLIRKKSGKNRFLVIFEPHETLDKFIDEKAWADYSITDDMATRLLLKEAMEKLPDEYLIPFKLSVMERYKYCEIAKMLHIKEGTVKSRINRAKARLREMLTDEE